MPQDVLSLTRRNRLYALTGWSLAAIAAFAATIAFLIAGGGYAEMSLFFGFSITAILAIVAVVMSYRSWQDMRGKQVAWATGPLLVADTTQRGQRYGGRACKLLITTSIYEDDISLEIDCGLVDQIRPHSTVTTVQDNPLNSDYRLAFKGTAQFILHSKLLLRLAVPPGRFIYERPGLSPTSAAPPV